MPDNNKISIITITQNNLLGLKKTINSFVNQKFSNCELIIVDGSSEDGTKDYLTKITNSNILINSKKDTGVYNAMNKGLELASGAWINFMNSGDTFFDENTLLIVQRKLNTSIDVLYGKCEIHYSNSFKRTMSPKPLKELWKGLSFSHQTVYMKAPLIKEKKFDETYKYCADFDLIYNLYLNQKTFLYFPEKIAVIEAGGVSDSKRYKATYEVYSIVTKQKFNIKIWMYFIFKISTGFLAVKLKRILPETLVKKGLKIKYAITK